MKEFTALVDFARGMRRAEPCLSSCEHFSQTESVPHYFRVKMIQLFKDLNNHQLKVLGVDGSATGL